jgi:SAM-dependent methyltransferase
MTDQPLYSALFQEPPDAAHLWDGDYKIPWHEPGFSQRMLAEHLSQDHDLASRNTLAIQKQVEWIHQNVCESQARRILDLGCGPGFYLKALSELGHDCHGMDISPASIEYARRILGDKAGAVLGDVRSAEFGTGFDVAAMIYGEFNVFSPDECRGILSKAFHALVPGGKLLLEVQKFEAVQGMGQSPPSWYKSESGLFSPDPHVCLIENHWYDVESTTLQQFTVIEAQSGAISTYRNTTKAWNQAEFRDLLSDAGFRDIAFPADWPAHQDSLMLITANRP